MLVHDLFQTPPEQGQNVSVYLPPTSDPRNCVEFEQKQEQSATWAYVCASSWPANREARWCEIQPLGFESQLGW